MYEGIPRPRFLKDIPLTLIRGITPVYYFNKYARNQNMSEVEQIYKTNLHFLSSSIKLLGDKINVKELADISETVSTFVSNSPIENTSHIEKVITNLSELCNKNQETIRKEYVNIKSAIINLYKETVKKIKVLIVDVKEEADKINKLESILKNFCYYETNISTPSSQDYSNSLIKNDFVLFSSIYPSQIHDLVKALDTYKKPGMALGYIETGAFADEQTIRNGAQLQKIGFPVLFKVFTPIRFFTTIDKLYFKYHLQ
jgi:hypothetical protein